MGTRIIEVTREELNKGLPTNLREALSDIMMLLTTDVTITAKGKEEETELRKEAIEVLSKLKQYLIEEELYEAAEDLKTLERKFSIEIKINEQRADE